MENIKIFILLKKCLGKLINTYSEKNKNQKKKNLTKILKALDSKTLKSIKIIIVILQKV